VHDALRKDAVEDDDVFVNEPERSQNAQIRRARAHLDDSAGGGGGGMINLASDCGAELLKHEIEVADKSLIGQASKSARSYPTRGGGVQTSTATWRCRARTQRAPCRACCAASPQRTPRTSGTLWRLPRLGGEDVVEGGGGTVCCLLVGKAFEVEGGDVAEEAVGKSDGLGDFAQGSVEDDEGLEDDLRGQEVPMRGGDNRVRFLQALEDVAEKFLLVDCGIGDGLEDCLRVSVRGVAKRSESGDGDALTTCFSFGATASRLVAFTMASFSLSKEANAPKTLSFTRRTVSSDVIFETARDISLSTL
jgi:hypothetical protein